MKEWPLEIGRIAISKAGRDEGRAYLVIEEVDSDFVKVSDGRLKPLSKPKIKRRKHLKPTEMVEMALRDKIMRGDKVFDHELRASLSHEEGK